MIEATPARLFPPQPNLGPEPWADPPHDYLTLMAIAALVVLAAAWFYLRRGGNARTKRPGGPPESVDRTQGSAREQLVELSNSIRDALTSRFGPAWRAKTTKELAADATLAAAVGTEGFDDLIRFLNQVDHLKFAPERAGADHASFEHELTTWQPKVIAIRARIRTQAGTRPGRKRARSDSRP